MTLTRLLLRRHRLLLGCWLLALTALSAGTMTAYQNTYPTAQQRLVAVELAQQNAAATLMYGRLPDPGTPAQLFAWEAGAFATILAAVMAVLVAVAVTRAVEDDGALELLRGCGVAPRQPLRSALTVLVAVAVALAAGCAAGAGIHTGQVDGVGWPGALAFGTVVGSTFLVIGVLTVALAQLAPTAGQARLLGFVAVGAAFAVRAVADTQEVAALNWFSPLGLRAIVQPFTGERWWALLPALLVTAALAGLAGVLSRRREFGAGLIRRRDTRDTRLRLRGPAGLVVRLTRAPLLTWTVAVAAIGALFAAMGSSSVQHSRHGELEGFLGAQLGTGDPAAGFLAYYGTVIGIVVSVYAVLSVLSSARSERAGLTDLVLAAGVRRWAPLGAQAAVTAAGCAVVLTATGAVSALIAPRVIDGDDIAVRTLGYALGQWPAAVAAAGCAVLLVGLRPRLSGLAWLPLVASGVLALLGTLLGVPDRLQRLGFFQHVPDIAAPDPATGGLLVLLALGAGLSLLGLLGADRREVVAG